MVWIYVGIPWFVGMVVISGVVGYLLATLLTNLIRPLRIAHLYLVAHKQGRIEFKAEHMKKRFWKLRTIASFYKKGNRRFFNFGSISINNGGMVIDCDRFWPKDNAHARKK